MIKYQIYNYSKANNIASLVIQDCYFMILCFDTLIAIIYMRRTKVGVYPPMRQT